jgi:hypothetical protein
VCDDRTALVALLVDNPSLSVPRALSTVAQRRTAYLVTDDPEWGGGFVERLRSLGFDALYNGTSTACDDLVAMMRGALVLRAAVPSQFSNLASILSGVPIVAFADAAAKAGTRKAKFYGQQARELERAWANEGLLNITYV